MVEQIAYDQAHGNEITFHHEGAWYRLPFFMLDGVAGFDDHDYSEVYYCSIDHTWKRREENDGRILKLKQIILPHIDKLKSFIL